MQSEFMTFQDCALQIKIQININPTDSFTNKITWSAILHNWILKLVEKEFTNSWSTETHQV